MIRHHRAMKQKLLLFILGRLAITDTLMHKIKDESISISFEECKNRENIPETADCERTFEQLVQKGNKLFLGPAMASTWIIWLMWRRDTPMSSLCTVVGIKRLNMGTYFDRDYQARYLTGMAAGKYTKTNVLGFIAPFGTQRLFAILMRLHLEHSQ